MGLCQGGAGFNWSPVRSLRPSRGQECRCCADLRDNPEILLVGRVETALYEPIRALLMLRAAEVRCPVLIVSSLPARDLVQRFPILERPPTSHALIHRDFSLPGLHRRLSGADAPQPLGAYYANDLAAEIKCPQNKVLDELRDILAHLKQPDSDEPSWLIKLDNLRGERVLGSPVTRQYNLS